MPGVGGDDIKVKMPSSTPSALPKSSLSQSGLRVNAPCASPGKSRKRRMALPRRILRLLKSSKRLHQGNASCTKKQLWCKDQFTSITSYKNDDLKSPHLNLCKMFIGSSGTSTDCVGVTKCNNDGAKIPQDNENALKSTRIVEGGSVGSSCYIEASHIDNSVRYYRHNIHTMATSECEPTIATNKKPKVVAIDCEMVGVGPKGRLQALARCSIVDYNGRTLYDQYVKPDQPVTDYRTKWSGIRPRNMTNAVPFASAREQVKNILRDKIVVGHAIFHDFAVLKLSHPPANVRDTSQSAALRRLLCQKSTPHQHLGLKALAKHLLNMEIQTGEHSSVEDAGATMKLYKLVEKRWEDELGSTHRSKKLKTSFLDDHFWPDDLFEVTYEGPMVVGTQSIQSD